MGRLTKKFESFSSQFLILKDPFSHYVTAPPAKLGADLHQPPTTHHAKIFLALSLWALLLCALCSVLCALCFVLCALCSVLCALCSVLCALCFVLCALCSKLSIINTLSLKKVNSNSVTLPVPSEPLSLKGKL